MNPRIHTLLFMMFFMCATTSRAIADGGQVIATATLGQEHAVMMVNPSRATVGMVAVIVRVTNGLLPVECVLSAHGASHDAPIQCALSDDPDGLGQRALIECSDASLWTISVRVASANGELVLNGTLQVAPAPPRWQSQLPWILVWIPLAALLFIRQVARRHTKQYDDAVDVFLPRHTL